MAIKDPITEEREEKMISSNGKPTLRIGRFLRPCADCSDKAASFPSVPLLSETISEKLIKCPSEILFKGCSHPQRKWKQWVEGLEKKQEPTWKKAGIYDAIMSSTYKIKVDGNQLFGLSEFWCSRTNTFVFPWGEVTMTLDDMLILGGFSVLGQPVTAPLTEEPLKKIEEKLIAEYKLLSGSKAKKVHHSSWINRFMGSEAEGERELEHVALLALWLSRYVFPSYPGEVVGKHVFSVAVHLSQGTRLGLAPAVLANLYKDLRLIHEQVSEVGAASVIVWAPFQLLQLWAWERFSLLRPSDSPNLMRPGEPRVSRWHKSNSKQLKFKLTLSHVRLILKQFNNFEWRPYMSIVNSWRRPSFYKEREELVDVGCLLVDNDMQSFVHCLRSCEIVGLGYIQQYLPHRVARQFGIDQDLPGHFERVNSDLNTVWSSYDRHEKDLKLYIRPRFIEAECTEKYSEWWKEMMIVRKEEIKDVLEKVERPSKNNFERNSHAETSKRNNEEQKNHNSMAGHPPGFAPKNVLERNEMSLKKNFEGNPQTETSKGRNEKQSNYDSWGDHPPGFAPKKAINDVLDKIERSSKNNFDRNPEDETSKRRNEDDEDYEPIAAIRKRRRAAIYGPETSLWY